MHRACICKHDALAYASTMQKTHAAISAICKYIHMQGTCMVFAWYLHGFCMVLHGICMVFAWELHAYASPMQVRTTTSDLHSPPLLALAIKKWGPIEINLTRLLKGFFHQVIFALARKRFWGSYRHSHTRLERVVRGECAQNLRIGGQVFALRPFEGTIMVT